MGLIKEPFETLFPLDIPVIDLRNNKNCCLHLPRDDKKQYVVFVEKENRVEKKIITVNDRNYVLDIRELQERFPKPVKTTLLNKFNAKDGEPSCKKSKTDSQE